MDMNCKSIQELMATGGDLPSVARDHVKTCPACMGFAQDLKAIEAAVPSLDATAPKHLRSRIEGRLTRLRSRVTWQAVAVSVAIVAIVTTPLAQIASKRIAGKYVKGDRIGTLPPFHAKFSGWNHMAYGDKLDGDGWFSGFAIRMKTTSIDHIISVENGTVYQYWKPDGPLEKRASRWGPNNIPVTPSEQVQFVDRWGPTLPAKGKLVRAIAPVSIKVLGRDYKTRAATYRLPVTKPGTMNTVEVPTYEIVYQDLETERIVRIDLIASFPGHLPQKETRQYEYTVPPDDRFETSTLKATPTSSLAMPTTHR